MDKSRVCISQATKLAKQKCVKKTNLLVYEKKPDPCAPAAAKKGKYNLPDVPRITTASAKKIRICTGADLKRMCPPKLCGCPPQKPKPGFFGILIMVLGFGLKAAIAGGLVYWTYDIGLWGDSEETEDLYLDMRDMIVPATTTRKKKKKLSQLCKAEIDLMCNVPDIRDKDGECLKAPSAENAVFTLKDYWNKGVVTAFDVLTDFPAYVAAAFNRFKSISENSKCKKTN